MVVIDGTKTSTSSTLMIFGKNIAIHFEDLFAREEGQSYLDGLNYN